MSIMNNKCQTDSSLHSISFTNLQDIPSSDMTLGSVFKSAIEIADYCATHASKVDHLGAFPVEEFRLIADAGLLAVPLLPQGGGLGFGTDSSLMNELLALLRIIGGGNLAVGRIYEGHINAFQLIQTFGTAQQIQHYAAEARDRRKIFGVWNAEGHDGVEIIALSNDRYRLQGSKTFCSGSGYVERPFVNGKLGKEWQMCVVPMERVETRSDPSWWQPTGMRATASYRVDFSGVEVTGQSLIGKPKDYNRQPWLSGGAIRFTAVQLGGAEALMNATQQYLQKLGRTHDPFQRMRMGQMAIAVESGKLWLKGAADLMAAYDPVFGGQPHSTPMPERVDLLVNYVNMARTAIEQICMDVIQLCERSVGTQGLMPPHPMERIIRDLTLYLRQPNFDATLQSVGQFVLSSPVSLP